MIDTRDLQTKTCKVLNLDAVPAGTGIIVGSDLVLTSFHVIESFHEANFSVIDIDNNTIDVHVADFCKNSDLALLRTDATTFINCVTLCNEEPIMGTEWATHGHPATTEGLSVGTKLDGTIHNIIAADHIHDVILSPGAIIANRDYRGFSGSGVLNSRNQVTSIMRFRDINDVCSVSVKKAEAFLKRNGVYVQDDELQSFDEFLPEAFQTISDPFKSLGITFAGVVAKATSPQAILSDLTGRLLFPELQGNMVEVISYLKRTPHLNKHLWLAWLEFLSYVSMLRGEYANINAVYITLPQAEISKFVEGVETKINQNITLTLQFFFTEQKEYFSIARQYLVTHTIAGTLQNNHCHIFHSHIPGFGFQPFTREDKKRIITDIASPLDAGLTIAGTVDYGVLSFSQLSMKVAGSQTIADATKHLIEIFTDAIS